MTDEAAMRVVLIGKDARTDAIAEACLASDRNIALYAFTQFRNPGLVERCVGLEVGDLKSRDEMLAYVLEVNPDLVIVGPEEPLASGLVDELMSRTIPVFGPSLALARVETSKVWTRRLLASHGVPGNPEHRIFESADGLRAYIEALGSCVVKPDGLTGGKGVRVMGQHLRDIDEACEYALSLIEDHGVVLVEERLDGEEFSLQTITDGANVVHCPVVQDHKRAYEGDTGPNTGGMGSYSCADGSMPFLTDAEVREAQAITERVVRALRAETGAPYRGVLYGGFIATANGVRLIEYNARFGDPEAMNILPIMESDFIAMCLSVVDGTLDRCPVAFSKKATVCKYVVPKGYPDGKGVGDEIVLAAVADPGLRIYWSAVNVHGDRVLLTGSRAVAFVGIADSLRDAEKIAEDGARAARGEVRHRADIGTEAAVGARIEHMRRLRSGDSSDR